MLSAFSDALIRNNPGIKITNTLYFNKYHTINLEIQFPSMRHALEIVGRHRWVRAFFRRKRYQVITTNISESMNFTFKEQRELPVIGLLESIRSLI